MHGIAFPEAMIQDYESLIDSMPNNPKDRHILAAAVYGKVDAIVTENARDFSREYLKRFGIERLSSDEFLKHQWYLDELLVMDRIESQAAACKKDIQQHLALLARMAPEFCSLVRASLQN